MNRTEKVIEVSHITKDYGKGRGNFDVSLTIHENEVVGIAGENGAGKTTLMRRRMGFIKPDSGYIRIYGKDSYQQSASLKPFIGYCPGEINFPDVKTGNEFLRSFGKSLGREEKDFAYASQLIKRRQLDIRAYPKRMSKGRKEKTAIVSARRRKPKILLLDEPSIGLDPLRREELLSLILEQKKAGATRFISSNSRDELSRVADKVYLLSKGRITDSADVKAVKNPPFHDYKVAFLRKDSYERRKHSPYQVLEDKPQYLQLVLRVRKEDNRNFLTDLALFPIKFRSRKNYDLSTYFRERRNGGQG